jgi:hypothetical protein
MTGVKERWWSLQCNNRKCRRMFRYFGTVRTNRGIRCTHCGKSSQYITQDFIKYNPPEELLK